MMDSIWLSIFSDDYEEVRRLSCFCDPFLTLDQVYWLLLEIEKNRIFNESLRLFIRRIALEFPPNELAGFLETFVDSRSIYSATALLEAGLDLNSRLLFPSFPILLRAADNCPQLIEPLILHGALPDLIGVSRYVSWVDSETLLTYLIDSWQLSILLMVLESSVPMNPDARNGMGDTCLTKLVGECVKRILGRYGEIRNDEMAVEQQSIQRLVSALKARGCNMNARNSFGLDSICMIIDEVAKCTDESYKYTQESGQCSSISSGFLNLNREAELLVEDFVRYLLSVGVSFSPGSQVGQNWGSYSEVALAMLPTDNFVVRLLQSLNR